MRHTVLAAILAVSLGACASETTAPASTAPEAAPANNTGSAPGHRALPVDPSNPHGNAWFKSAEDGLPAPTPPSEARPAQVGAGVAVDLLPAPEVVLPPARPRRRMNLDQLNGAIRQASGGFGWTELRGATEVDLFVELGATLGKPDFIQITTEDLEPSALFQKFLDDAARSVCGKMLAHDQNQSRSVDDRVLVRHVGWDDDRQSAPEAVDANLRWLLSRVHSRRVAADSPALSGWRWQFDGLRFSGASPAEAWNAVCVALFTHPDFFSY
jgi:hypothetical protein